MNNTPSRSGFTCRRNYSQNSMADVLYSYPSQFTILVHSGSTPPLRPVDTMSLNLTMRTPLLHLCPHCTAIQTRLKKINEIIFYKIQIGFKLDIISLDKLKQVFSDASPALPPPRVRPLRRPPPPVLSAFA